MQALTFYLVYPLLYAVSLLPFPLLYLFSDFVYVLLYYIAGYRVQVVRQNLLNSFPQKTETERRQIEKDYYHYLADTILETVKLFSLSGNNLRRRITYTNAGLFDTMKAKGHKLVIVTLGHQGNWEWAGPCTSQQTPHPLLGVYKKLSNPYFDQMMVRMRARFGNQLVPMEQTLRQVIAHRNEFHILALIADQTPSSSETACWTTFLNQDTPMLTGAATLAQKFNAPLLFAQINRVGRGRYTIQLEVLTEEPAKYRPQQLTEMYAKKLEEGILNEPACWLWSHRRWKHKRKV